MSRIEDLEKILLEDKRMTAEGRKILLTVLKRLKENRERSKKWHLTPKGKKSQMKYKQSEKGKAAIRRGNLKRKEGVVK